MIRSYTELIRINKFEDRYAYLKMEGKVGLATFGYDRYLNQMLYNSKRWRRTRDGIIVRDEGCDLGIEGREINGRIYIHHINPITVEDIELNRRVVFEPENLICSSFDTHNAIHYGNESLLPKLPIIRKPYDTCPWR